MVFALASRLVGFGVRSAAVRTVPPEVRHYSQSRDFLRLRVNDMELQRIKQRTKAVGAKATYQNRIAALRKGAALIVVSAKQKAPKSAGFLANAPGKKNRKGNYKGGRNKGTGAWRMIQARAGKPPSAGASSVGIGVHRSGFWLRFHETGYFAVGRRSRTITTRTLFRGHFSRKTRRAVSVRGVRQYASGTAWVPPRPYLRPALHEQKYAAAQMMMDHMLKKLISDLPRISFNHSKL